MRLFSFAIVLLTCGPTFAEAKPATAPDSGTALEPWAWKAQPSDAAKSYVENITTGEHKYIVVHGAGS